MITNVFRKTGILLMTFMLFSVILSSSAEANKKRHWRDSQINRVDVSIGWTTSRSINFIPVNGSGSKLNYELENGFKMIFSYHPYEYFRFGLHYTNWANAKVGDISQTKHQFGALVYLATPWAKPRQVQALHYRVKIGAVIDLNGTKVIGTSDGSSPGRLREHKGFASLELGIKAFGAKSTGMLFTRFTLSRALYAFSNGTNYNCRPDGLMEFSVDLGIGI